MVSFGAGDLIYKRAAAAGIEARHFIMLQAWFFCPLVTFYALARQKLVLEPAALWGLSRASSCSSRSTISRGAWQRLDQRQRADLPAELHADGGVRDRAAGRPVDVTKLVGLGLAFIAVIALAGGSQGNAPSASG